MSKKKSNKGQKTQNVTIIFDPTIPESEKTMLHCIENVLLYAENSELKEENMEIMKGYLDYISDLQDIKPMQALLLSFFVEKSSDGDSVTIARLARNLGCTKVRVMQYQEDINDLVKRKFLMKVKRRYGESLGYVVPKSVITAFIENKRFVPKSLTAKDGVQFFQMVHELTHLRKEEVIDTEMLREEFEQLLEANKDLRYVKAMKRLNLPSNSNLIITSMARHLVLNQSESVSYDSLNYLFDDRHEAYYELNSLENGDHILMKKHLVEYTGKEDFLNRSIYKLTASAREKLLKGYSLPKRETNIGSIKAANIVQKNLFFNEKVGRQIEDLSQMLDGERLTAIQTRLKEHGRRTGFACLFYGAPGTGKTESVLQIARSTGRDIMQVDMSEIKSKWVGESEQNIKAVFDNYRTFCKTCDKTPILLFNEADAILGTILCHAQTP